MVIPAQTRAGLNDALSEGQYGNKSNDKSRNEKTDESTDKKKCKNHSKST